MRAYWTGSISFSLVTIPIKLYAAVESGQSVSFRQLHEKDFGPVGYEKRCKKCGEILTKDEIVRGYEYDEDQYVVVEDEEIDALKLESTKTIEIEAMVPAGEIDFALFDRPYIVGPANQPAVKTYELLRRAMEDDDVVAIGRVVISGRERMMGIRPQGDGLMAYQLRYPAELRSIDDAPLVGDKVDIDQKQLKLAKQLVDTMKTPFDELEMEDRYQAAVMEIVEAKVEGRDVVTVEEAAEPERVPDVMSALEESIKRLQEDRKPAKGKRTTRKPPAKKKKDEG
jgi:DNA end-binding protein Ku